MSPSVRAAAESFAFESPHHGATSSFVPSMDSILRDARLINSDIGCHSVKSNFSTRLSGRFYQNGSLEQHAARQSRLVEMQAKKRRLEKELELEERRVKLLEERLNETEIAREKAQGMILVIERGVLQLQSLARRKQAVKRLNELKDKYAMSKIIAIFFQSRYRGWKGRLLARLVRQESERKLIEKSATIIQASVKCRIQRNRYLDNMKMRKEEEIIATNHSASVIQAMLRGKMARRVFMMKIRYRKDAAVVIQRQFRGRQGRVVAELLRKGSLTKKVKEPEKPKRVPLHRRRYSTYGLNAPAARRANNGTLKRDINSRRRSSDGKDVRVIVQPGLSIIKDEPDENDSIATTITTISHATEHSRKRSMLSKSSDNSTGRSSDKIKSGSLRRSANTRGSLSASSKQNSNIYCKKRPRNLLYILPFFGCESIEIERRCGQDAEEDATARTTNENEFGRAWAPKHCKKHNRGLAHLLAVMPFFGCDSLESEKCSENEVSGSDMNRDSVSTPITITSEASLIVEDVLGRDISRIYSTSCAAFEDDFSENENDLE